MTGSVARPCSAGDAAVCRATAPSAADTTVCGAAARPPSLGCGRSARGSRTLCTTPWPDKPKPSGRTLARTHAPTSARTPTHSRGARSLSLPPSLAHAQPGCVSATTGALSTLLAARSRIAAPPGGQECSGFRWRRGGRCRLGRGRPARRIARPARPVAVHLGQLVVPHGRLEAVSRNASGRCAGCSVIARQPPAAALPLGGATNRHTAARLHEAHSRGSRRGWSWLLGAGRRHNCWLASSASGPRNAWLRRRRHGRLQRSGRPRGGRCRPGEHRRLRLGLRRAPKEHAHHRGAHAPKSGLRLLGHLRPPKLVQRPPASRCSGGGGARLRRRCAVCGRQVLAASWRVAEQELAALASGPAAAHLPHNDIPGQRIRAERPAQAGRAVPGHAVPAGALDIGPAF